MNHQSERFRLSIGSTGIRWDVPPYTNSPGIRVSPITMPTKDCSYRDCREKKPASAQGRTSTARAHEDVLERRVRLGSRCRLFRVWG